MEDLFTRLRKRSAARPFKRFPNQSVGGLVALAVIMLADLALYLSVDNTDGLVGLLLVLALMTALAVGACVTVWRQNRLIAQYAQRPESLNRATSNQRFRRWLQQAPENEWLRRRYEATGTLYPGRLPLALLKERAAVYTVSAHRQWKEWRPSS